MRTKYFLMFFVLALSSVFSCDAFAQRCLVFKYDADGNRTRRTVSENCGQLRDALEISEVTDNEEEMMVYPNPTSGIFKISMTKDFEEESSHYELYDVNGVMIMRNRLKKETDIDIGGLPSGVYLLKIVSGDDVISRIILKQ